MYDPVRLTVSKCHQGLRLASYFAIDHVLLLYFAGNQRFRLPKSREQLVQLKGHRGGGRAAKPKAEGVLTFNAGIYRSGHFLHFLLLSCPKDISDLSVALKYLAHQRSPVENVNKSLIRLVARGRLFGPALQNSI